MLDRIRAKERANDIQGDGISAVALQRPDPSSLMPIASSSSLGEMQNDGGGFWEYLFPDEKQSDANVTGTSSESKGKGKGIGMGKGKGKSSEVYDSGCSMTVSGEPHSWGWGAPMANQWPDPPVITLTSRRGGEALPGGSSSDPRPDGCEPEAG